MSQTLTDGRYRIERQLGRGGMAGVYLAHDEELDRLVALKLLSEHLAADETFQARFLREARLAARLSHPNVVRVYDAGEADGRPFIVMEYVPGTSLAQSTKLPAGRVVELGVQACAGLQHAHDAGLVHRDIKPGNLLLRDDGVLKIADFGIARATESTRHTQAGALLGTAAYVAPEQIAGEDATAASDVYALGAVLYELLTGRLPYEFDSLVELATVQADGWVVPPGDREPDVPRHVEAAIMRALARDPRFRPASPAVLARELGSTDVEPPTPLLPTRRPRGRRRWLLLAAAVTAALVGLALGLLEIGGSGSSSPPPAPKHVAPPAPGATPKQQAENLARWLRAHSR